jgi:hypothetical protein
MTRNRWIALAVAAMVLASAAFAADPISRVNWVSSVGFAPNLNILESYKPGVKIDESNVEQYKSILMEPAYLLAKKYKLVLKTVPYKPTIPADNYIGATQRNRGKARLVDTGNDPRKRGIYDYVAGLPFPQPKTGLEVAWNFIYAYNGDDADNYFGVYWVSAKRGVERFEEWTWKYIVRTLHRTDVPPIPAIPEFAEDDRQYVAMTITRYPQDKKGFAALYWRYMEPKDQEGYIYIPAQRRSTKFSFGTRGDAWNNTDLLYEDVRGYLGYPEWMNWTLVGKTTVLAPMHAGMKYGKENIKTNFDFENWPHWNPKMNWELRPVYVLDVTPKFKEYPYSKMRFWIDAEYFYILGKTAYDKKGQLWKVLINSYNGSLDERKAPINVATSTVVDLQAEHSTVFPWFESKVNVGLTADDFSLTNLRKFGR